MENAHPFPSYRAPINARAVALNDCRQILTAEWRRLETFAARKSCKFSPNNRDKQLANYDGVCKLDFSNQLPVLPSRRSTLVCSWRAGAFCNEKRQLRAGLQTRKRASALCVRLQVRKRRAKQFAIFCARTQIDSWLSSSWFMSDAPRRRTK